MWLSGMRACARFSPTRWACRGKSILEASAGTAAAGDGVCQRSKSYQEALAAAARRGFDLASEPPLRAHLFVLGGERACAAAAAAPHCQRRLVAWRRCGAIWRRPMRRGAQGQAPDLSGIAGAICRLHAVAASMLWAGERCRTAHRAAARVLDRDAQGPSRSDRSADRPAEACGGEPSRRQRSAAHRAPSCTAACWTLARDEPGEPVHGAAGWACGSADAAWRGHRHSRSAARSRAAPTARLTIWLGFSSTRWCCAPTRRAIRASAS